MTDKSVGNGAGLNEGAPGITGKSQRDTGFEARPQQHWWFRVLWSTTAAA
jgi:hypothetical protein